MDNVTVQDLIIHSYDQKPIEFQDSFNTLMMDRIVKAIDQKKFEVAQAMFGDQPASEDFESEQDQEDNLDGEAA